MADLEPRIRDAGLLTAGRPVLVMLSGGRDSVCLLDLAVRISGTASALHVNYGLRAEAGEDEAHCRALCEGLGVALEVHRPPAAPAGNLQAWARDQRYGAAARAALHGGADIAAGHTASDQVETVLYRLAASPGRRALLGMPAREGRLVRPLLGVTREQTAAHCRARGLRWREDASNDDPVYARNRIRHRLMPVLRALHPAAEANVLRTLDMLRDEAAVLDGLVESALREAGWRGRGGASAAALEALPGALRRLALQRMADAAFGAGAPAVDERALRGADLGRGLRSEVAAGVLSFAVGRAVPPGEPAAVRLEIPGSVSFAGGEVSGRLGEFDIADGTLDAEALGAAVEVRAWRDGDRMRPLGLGGSKSLQDLFTDRRVPRERRHRVPVVVAGGGEIVWVPGVATGERFRVTESTRARARLHWRAPR